MVRVAALVKLYFFIGALTMSIQFDFQNNRALDDEKTLYRILSDYFNNQTVEHITVTRKITPDCIMHVFKNLRTRNTAVIKDRRDSQRGVSLTIYDRLPHIAQNIGHQPAITCCWYAINTVRRYETHRCSHGYGPQQSRRCF